jgi:hypothetical protein
MRLWWLSFRGGTAVVMRAESLVHARLLAVVNELGRAHLFDDGFRVDPELELMIPDDFIGRTLSRDKASDLLRSLRGDPRYGIGQIQQARIERSRRVGDIDQSGSAVGRVRQR